MAVDAPSDPNATNIRIRNNDPYKHLDHLGHDAYGYVDKLLPVFSGGSVCTTSDLGPKGDSNQSWMGQERPLETSSRYLIS